MKNKIFRELEDGDIDYLLRVEESFPNPWPREAFFIEMDGEFNKNLALEVDDVLVGYVFYSAYDDEININHFAIDPDHRRKGYASDILNELLSRMKARQLLYLEVNTTNEAAIRLYEKFGLRIISTRKNYYGQGQDAYIMQKDRRIN